MKEPIVIRLRSLVENLHIHVHNEGDADQIAKVVTDQLLKVVNAATSLSEAETTACEVGE